MKKTNKNRIGKGRKKSNEPEPTNPFFLKEYVEQNSVSNIKSYMGITSSKRYKTRREKENKILNFKVLLIIIFAILNIFSGFKITAYLEEVLENIIELVLILLGVSFDSIQFTYADYFVLASIPFFFIWFFRLLTRLSMMKWRKVTAKITFIDVVEDNRDYHSENFSNVDGYPWKVSIEYKYFINNKNYSGVYKKIFYPADSFGNAFEHAMDFSKKYKKGNEITIFYNPWWKSASIVGIQEINNYNWALAVSIFLILIGFIIHLI